VLNWNKMIVMFGEGTSSIKIRNTVLLCQLFNLKKELSLQISNLEKVFPA